MGLEGCNDHGCYVEKPKGQGTNGTCRCPEWKLKSKIRRQDVRIKELETTLKDLTCDIAYHSYCVDLKPQEQWDEYDYMMAPRKVIFPNSDIYSTNRRLNDGR